MRKPAYNPTSQPVVIDDEGHTLGGGEWASVDPASDRVTAAVEAGDLIVRDELPPSADPQIREACGLDQPAPPKQAANSEKRSS